MTVQKKPHDLLIKRVREAYLFLFKYALIRERLLLSEQRWFCERQQRWQQI